MSANIIETCLNSINKAKKFNNLNFLITNTFDSALNQAKELQSNQSMFLFLSKFYLKHNKFKI
jgi:hypothetical protein